MQSVYSSGVFNIELVPGSILKVKTIDGGSYAILNLAKKVGAITFPSASTEGTGSASAGPFTSPVEIRVEVKGRVGVSVVGPDVVTQDPVSKKLYAAGAEVSSVSGTVATLPNPIALLSMGDQVETRKMPKASRFTKRNGSVLLDTTQPPNTSTGTATRANTLEWSVPSTATTGSSGSLAITTDGAGTYFDQRWNATTFKAPADGVMQFCMFVPAGAGANFSYTVSSASGTARFAPNSLYIRHGAWNVFPIWLNDADMDASLKDVPNNIVKSITGAGVAPGETITQFRIEITVPAQVFTWYVGPLINPPRLKPLVCITIDASDTSFYDIVSMMTTRGLKGGLRVSNSGLHLDAPPQNNYIAAALAAGWEVVNGTWSRLALAGATETQLIREYTLTENKMVQLGLPVAHDYACSAGNSVPAYAVRQAAYPKLGKRFVRGQGLRVDAFSPIGLQETTNMGCAGLGGGIALPRAYYRTVKKLGGVLNYFGHGIEPRNGSNAVAPANGNNMWTEEFAVLLDEIAADANAGLVSVVQPSMLSAILDGRA